MARLEGLGGPKRRSRHRHGRRQRLECQLGSGQVFQYSKALPFASLTAVTRDLRLRQGVRI
jgi:hypothetical protein